MNPHAYHISLERVPSYHPLFQKRSYQRGIEQRDVLCARMQGRPVPQGWQGFIVEVNTSLLWAVERPQLVLGTVEERVRVRLKDADPQALGSRGLEVVREDTFVEVGASQIAPPLTVYTDDRLDIEVEAIGRTASRASQAGTDSSAQEQGAPLPMRRHRRKRRSRGEPAQLGESAGRTFTSEGSPFPVGATHSGTPLSVHMLVRLLVPQDYPLAIARSSFGIRRSFSPDEVFAKRIALGVCYEPLFLPGQGDAG